MQSVIKPKPEESDEDELPKDMISMDEGIKDFCLESFAFVSKEVS